MNAILHILAFSLLVIWGIDIYAQDPGLTQEKANKIGSIFGLVIGGGLGYFLIKKFRS